MSFTDRHTTILIGVGDWLDGEETPAIDEVLNPSEEGWDTLVVSYIHRVPELTPEDCATTYPQGAQLGTRKFWITSAKPVRRAPGVWIAEVSFKGWAGEKPVKVRVGSAAEQQQAENVEIIEVGTFAKAQIHQNTPTITISYLVEDVTDELVEMTSKVGSAQTPPETIDTPPNFWTSLDPFLYHFPNGWVLMGSDQDRLPGTTAALVSDTYKYIQAATPG
jgi:hypothetical protein